MTTKLTRINLNMGEFYQTENLDQGETADKPYHNAMTLKDEEPIVWDICLSRNVMSTESVEVRVYAQTEGEAIDIVAHHIEHDSIDELEGGYEIERDDYSDEYEEWEQITNPSNPFSIDRDTYKDRKQAFTDINKCREVNKHLHE
jgi:hypothetical protein